MDLNTDIYTDIARRTGGDIYIGVVGPVRTGKSTFIKQFMEKLVIPNIDSEYKRERALDELPQSAGGRTIMTTEPKFIPEEAAQLTLPDGASFRVRLIDCVGYIIPSAVGYIENEAPRMVMTSWFDDEIPFNMAAEVGTRKVITEHSTIGLVITTDGSITDLPREEYEECEERVIQELESIRKPYVILLNSAEPRAPRTLALAEELSEKYGSTVIPVSCLDLTEEDVRRILGQALYAFPVREINISMPGWVNSLAPDHWLKTALFGAIREAAEGARSLSQVSGCAEELGGCEYVASASLSSLDPGSGTAVLSVTLDQGLFYRVLGEATGLDISGENELMPALLELVELRDRFKKYSAALDQMEQTGYGVVMPELSELSLEEPEIIKQGGKYGVRLRASAPAVHLVRTNVRTEVAPIVGSERQSEELVMYMMSDFESSPEKIWDSNIFGKSLHELVSEGLHTKLDRLPMEARGKLRETIERMINDGCSGLICLIL